MARKKRKRRLAMESEEEPALEVTSLIDISFLLLMYFLVTSTLQPKEADLGMTLPTEVPKATTFKLDPMTIRIEPDGSVYKGSELIESDTDKRRLDKLLTELRTYKKAAELTDAKPVVIVDADDQAKQQRLIDVINALGKADIENITMTGFRDDK